MSRAARSSDAPDARRTARAPRGPTIAWSALAPTLRTGDVVLFHGASRRSRVIEDVTRSKFSHIGMIVRPDAAAPPRLWHTDPRPVTADLEDRARHGGAQLNDLGEALARMTQPSYGDTPYVRRLDAARGPEFEAAAQRAVAELDQTPFPSLLAIVKEWVFGHLRIATSGRRMYCAELLALTWQRMGLLGREPPANAYAPEDFAHERGGVRLRDGAKLGPLLQVTQPPGGGSR